MPRKIRVLTLSEKGEAVLAGIVPTTATRTAPPPKKVVRKSIHVRMSENWVKRLKATTAILDYYDINTPNLCLRVSPKTKRRKYALKAWRWAYRHDGVAAVLTFGHHPVWTYEMVVAKVHKAQVALDEKKDPKVELYPHQEPAQEPVAAPPANTVHKMVLHYDDNWLSRKSDTHRNNVIGLFRKYIDPRLSKKKSLPPGTDLLWSDWDIHSVDREAIGALLNKIRADGHARTANLMASTLSAWFNVLLDQGKVAVNPAARLKKTKEESRDVVLTLHQLTRVWRAGELVGGPGGRMVRTLVVVPVRLNEAARLVRTEVSLPKQEWMLPKARNGKGKRDFLTHITPLFISILKECPNTGDYMFSVSGARPFGGMSTLKKNIDAAIIKLEQPGEEPLPHWTFHDLRRSIATILPQLGVSSFIKERLLNHAMNKLEGTYDRYGYVREKAAALRKWDACLTAALADPNYVIPGQEEMPQAAE